VELPPHANISVEQELQFRSASTCLSTSNFTKQSRFHNTPTNPRAITAKRKVSHFSQPTEEVSVLATDSTRDPKGARAQLPSRPPPGAPHSCDAPREGALAAPPARPRSPRPPAPTRVTHYATHHASTTRSVLPELPLFSTSPSLT